MPFSKKKLFLRIVVALLLLVLGVGGLLYVRLSDEETVKGMVIAELEKHLKRKITIHSVDVLFDEGMSVGLNEFVVYSASGNRPDFNAQRVLVGFRIVPFLSGQVSIRSIIVKGALLEVVRGSDGTFRFNFSEQPPSLKTDEGIPNLVLAGLIRTVKFLNGTLRFVDRRVNPDAPVVTAIEDLDVTISRSLLASSLVTQVSGNVKVDADNYSYFQSQAKLDFPRGFAEPKHVLLNGNLEIENLTLIPFGAYLREGSSDPLKGILMDGRLSYQWVPEEPFRVQGHLTHYPEHDGAPALTAGEIPQQGVLELDLTWDGDTLSGKKLNYQSGDFQVQAAARWERLGSENPLLDVQLKTGPWTVERMRQSYPFKWVPVSMLDSIPDWIVSGGVEIASLSFYGDKDAWASLGAAGSPDNLSADLLLRDVTLGPRLKGLKHVTGSLSFKNNTAQMRFQEARFQKFHIQKLSGTIERPFSSPQADFKFHLMGRLQDHYRQLPETGSGFSQKALREVVQQFQGQTQSVLHVTGPLEHPELLKIRGDIALSQGRIQAAGLDSPFTAIKGDIHFENFPADLGKHKKKKQIPDFDIRFANLSAQCRQHLFKGFEGQVRVRQGKLVHHIEGKVQFGAFQGEDVAALHTDNRFKDFLRKLVISSGVALVDYREERRLKSGAVLSRKGSVRLDKVSVRHSGRFRPLNNVSGILDFHDQKFTFQSREAWYGNTPVTVHAGLFNLGGPMAELILKINGKTFHSEDFSGLPFLGKLNAEGPVAVEAVLHATESALSLKSKVDLTQAAYRYKNQFVKPAQTRNRLEMMATFSETHPVEFKSLVFDLDGNTVSGEGWLGAGDRPEFAFTVAGKKVRTVSIAPFVRALSETHGGTFDFEVSGKGWVEQPERAEYKGFVKIRGIQFTPDDLMVPVRLTTDAWFVNRVVKIKKGLADFKRSALAFEGKYISGPEPEMELTVTGDRLNLNEILAPAKTSSEAGLPDFSQSKLLMQGKGFVDVDVKELVYRYWDLHRVAGRFDFHRGRVDTKNLTLGHPKRDLLSVQARMMADDPAGPKYEAILTTRQTLAEGFFDRFGDTFDPSLEGRVARLRARLRMQGNTLKAITKTLNGDLVLEIQNGHIHTGNLLNGSARLFGYKLDPEKAKQRQREKKEPYKLIKGNFLVRNGIAVTENFMFEDNDRLVSLVGAFNLNRHDMEIVVGVAPLRSVDKFIQNIPLVGKIITAGDEKSVFKTYYEISGPFSGPETKAVPFTSLGKKVVGMVQGILQAPSDILFGEDNPTRQN